MESGVARGLSGSAVSRGEVAMGRYHPGCRSIKHMTYQERGSSPCDWRAKKQRASSWSWGRVDMAGSIFSYPSISFFSSFFGISCLDMVFQQASSHQAPSRFATKVWKTLGYPAKGQETNFHSTMSLSEASLPLPEGGSADNEKTREDKRGG